MDITIPTSDKIHHLFINVRLKDMAFSSQIEVTAYRLPNSLASSIAVYTKTFDTYAFEWDRSGITSEGSMQSESTWFLTFG